MNNQFKGGASKIIIVIIALIIAAVGGYIFLQNRSQKVALETTTTPMPTTTEEPTTTVAKVTTTATPKPETTTFQTTPEMFDVKIASATCQWSVKTGASGNPIDCLRAVVSGTATGPVGARLELPLLVWSDDKVDCGSWTHYAGALIAVGNTCRRMAGQPETTTWTVDTGGEDCPLKYGFKNSRTYNVKIYANNDINAKKQDVKNYLCQ
jgi:hypothetical protein